MLERLCAFLERFQERHFEPQNKAPARIQDAWLWYRIERLERRVKWIFLLALIVPTVEVISIAVWLLIAIVST